MLKGHKLYIETLKKYLLHGIAPLDMKSDRESQGQGVFLAVGVWAFPTGNLKGRQEILDYFGQLVEIKQLVLFLETRILMANPIGQ